mgnify:CR=1 FL=1
MLVNLNLILPLVYNSNLPIWSEISTQSIKNPLIKSAVAHIYFESIHPFEDGNGRIGRAISEKALSQGLNAPVIFSLSRALETKRKEYCLQKNYGITQQEYDDKLQKQNYSCYLCKSPVTGKALAVDHCHTTNVIRGMLCNHCNRGLGHFKDDPQLLEFARIYLLSYNKDSFEANDYLRKWNC